MATIENRAVACCMTKFPDHETADAESMRLGYINGAIEQREIDIKRSCKVIHDIMRDAGYDLLEIIDTTGLIRKAMMEG